MVPHTRRSRRDRARGCAGLAGAVALAAAVAAPAHAAAPGWSTPQTASSYKVGTYFAGPDGQGAQIFGNGAVQSMTPQLRAIKTNAAQGTASGVSAGVPGFDSPALSVNANGRLVAAWTLDTEGTGPIGLAATLGSRTSLPKSAIVLPTDGQSVTGVATAIDAGGNGVVAWIEGPSNAGVSIVKAATLRSGQAPVVVAVNARAGASLTSISLGLDGDGRPTVAWAVSPAGAAAGVIAVARGDANGAFAPAFEQQLGAVTIGRLQTFAAGDGALLALWLEGDAANGPLAVRTAQAPAGGTFGAPRTLISGTPGRGQPSFAANASGRAAVIFPLASGGGTTLRVVLRTAAGNWGSTRTLGTPGRYVTQAGAGVDAKGRVVALWDDGSSSASGATRILAARTGSSTSPLGSYNQVSQRSGESRCNAPVLFLSTSGDGLGSWQCAGKPRLARLTAPS